MSVTIAGEPVLIDVEDSIRDWVNCYLDGVTDDPFFVPPHSFFQSVSGSSHSNNFYFESALPSLPKLELGRIQWPAVGVSRFARGLFAVDSFALAKIALEAWGVVWDPGTSTELGVWSDEGEWDDSELWEDSTGGEPGVWSPTRNYAVDVRLVSSDDPLVDLTVKFFVLQPIRISDQCWLLRLVDLRYFKSFLSGPIDALPPESSSSSGAGAEEAQVPVDIPVRTWEELCEDLTLKGIDVDYSPDSASVGVPDILYANANAPLPEMADSIAYSVGCRPVVQLRENANSPFMVKVQCQRLATAATLRNTLYASAKVTGGSSNVTTSPMAVDFMTPSPWSYYRGAQKTEKTTRTLSGYGPSVSCHSTMLYQKQLDESNVHNSWEPRGLYEAYHSAIADTMLYAGGWNQSEHAICLPGIVEVSLSGHDDYIEFDWSKNGPTTRVVSLPVTFFPKGLLAQHPVEDPDFESSGSESSYPDCPWFSVEKSHAFGVATEDADAGEYVRTKRAWRGRFVNVQIVNSALGVVGSEAKFRKVRVKALNCHKEDLSEKDSVRLYFGDQMIVGEESDGLWVDSETWDDSGIWEDSSGGEVSLYTGWILCSDTAPASSGPQSIEGPIVRFEGGDAILDVQASSSADLLGVEVAVIDLSGCVLDESEEDLIGVWVWAAQKVHAGGVDFVAFNRCCV